MVPPSTVILGTGSFLPPRVLTNDELSLQVDTSDEWIRTRTGISQRRIAAQEVATSDLAVEAARVALADADLEPQDIDLLLIATITPDYPMPATACVVQAKLGLPSTAACFDLNAACSGFIYGLDTASAMISSGRYKHALVIGVEKLSSIVDWQDRNTCVLFGDGAGAVILARSEEKNVGIIGTKLGAFGGNTELLCIPHGGTRSPVRSEHLEARANTIQMKGKEVFKIAVRAMEDACRDILEQHRIQPDQIACVIPHQANLRIIESIAHYLQLPMDRFFINVDRYGNTSAASIPIALDEARRSGRISRGDLILLVAFGAGLTYGSALIRW